MKKRMPRWKKYVLGLLACFCMTIVSGLLLDQNENSVLGALLATAVGITFLGMVVSILVRIGKRIFRKSTEGHQNPKTVRVRGAGNRGKSDGQMYVYSRKETYTPNPKAPGVGWGIIILSLFLLYPVGLFVTVQKTLYEKNGMFRNGSVLMIVGGIYTALPLSLAILLLLTEEGDSRLFCLIPGVGVLFGLILLAYGWILRRTGRENDTYMTLLTVDRVTQIDRLAVQCHTTYARVTKVVDRLIRSDILPGAYLHHREREVIIPGISPKIAVRCEMCGGTTVLYASDPRICTYCGAAI